jgi:hypothetical protein
MINVLLVGTAIVTGIYLAFFAGIVTKETYRYLIKD